MTINKQVKQVAIAGLGWVMSAAAYATAEGGASTSMDILQRIKYFKSVVIESIGLGHAVAIFMGLCLAIAGLIMIATAKNANDPSKTKTGGIVLLVIGVCLGGISAIMNIGAVSATGADSEFDKYYSSTESGK